MPPGYHGCYLRIDASNGHAERVPLADDLLRQYLGGSGLGTRLLLDEGGATVDPLAPGAPIVFAFSPLVGTPDAAAAARSSEARTSKPSRFAAPTAASGRIRASSANSPAICRRARSARQPRSTASSAPRRTC